MGNKLSDLNVNNYYFTKSQHMGIIIKLDFDNRGKLIETTKLLNFMN